MEDNGARSSGNLTPFGGYDTIGSTNQFTFVTDISGGFLFVMATLLVMTIITIIILIVELLYIRKEDETEKHRRLNNSLIVSGIFTLLTPMSFSYLLSQDMGTGFWGSYSNDSIIDWSFGPNLGWYVQIFAFVLVLSVIIIVLTSNKTIARKLVR
jgi:hypothetical protein